MYYYRKYIIENFIENLIQILQWIKNDAIFAVWILIAWYNIFMWILYTYPSPQFNKLRVNCQS